jgi:hypothetical protein
MKARRTGTGLVLVVVAAAACSCAAMNAMLNGAAVSRSDSVRLLQSDDGGMMRPDADHRLLYSSDAIGTSSNATAATLPVLVAPPWGVLAVAATASVGLGLVALAAVDSKPDKGSKNFFTLEFLDLMTDVAGYFLTRSDGDLEFANDPAGLINAALLASVAVSGLSFIVELGLRYRWQPQQFRDALPFLQALHFACEDSFQTILYATVAGAQAGGHAGASGATVFAVLQALGFVAMKLNDMYASRARTVTAGVACCLATVATITVIVVVATLGASADCDGFQCPAGTSALVMAGLADGEARSCVAYPCEVAECCATGEQVEGATALEAAHELDSSVDSSVDSGLETGVGYGALGCIVVGVVVVAGGGVYCIFSMLDPARTVAR